MPSGSAQVALTGQAFTLETIEAAAAALHDDFAPLTDVRGSAEYRRQVAGNLLRRMWHQSQGAAISVLDCGAANG